MSKRYYSLKKICIFLGSVAITVSISMLYSVGRDDINSAALSETLQQKLNDKDKLLNDTASKKFLFIDLQSHWTRSFVEGLMLQGELSEALITSGSLNQFQPDRLVSRNELANLLSVAFENSKAPKITTRLTDLATKAEALVAIARELDLNPKSVKEPQTYLLSMYRDAIQIPDYAIPAIATITKQGLVSNYPDPRVISPTNAITKGELAALLYQALAYQKRLPALKSPYTIDPNRQIYSRDRKQITRLEVSISKRKVTAFHGEVAVKTYPIAVGRAGWGTPVGNHRVLQTIEYPAWENPFTGDVIASKDPENPLGDRWIGFWTNGREWSGFHGTPNRASVGQAASHGCIRMYNEDIRELYSQVTTATTVRVSP